MAITGSMAGTSLRGQVDRSAAGHTRVRVYYEPGRFGGWPANHGMWIWGDELLVGFSRGYYKDLGDRRHNIDRDRPEEHVLARSLDGGRSWTLEQPNEKGFLIPHGPTLHGTELPGVRIPEMTEPPGGIDFTHPDFALTCRMTNTARGPSSFSYSYDRGRTWIGPFRLPDMGTPGVAARTDYIVNGRHDLHAFLTAAKPDLEEGRAFAARTTDGGRTWTFLGWIGPEPTGYAIMPATVRLGETELLSVVRRRDGRPAWTEAFLSEDNGVTWRLLNRPSDDLGDGNPASLVRLKDGRVCYCYGHRARHLIGARLSDDGGRTWGPEIVLREGLGNRDLGYPRTVQRPDGQVVTTYYGWDPALGPERFIEATIWNPSRGRER